MLSISGHVVTIIMKWLSFLEIEIDLTRQVIITATKQPTSIYKFKKVTCLPLGVRRGRPAGVGVCGVDSLDVSVKSQLRADSFTYFGEVLRCPHKRIITITKVYIARNNIHMEIIRFHTN